MDDANIPSLLSLPYLGFVDQNDETYQNTRRLVLSRSNPYYFEGTRGAGIGGPHVSTCDPNMRHSDAAHSKTLCTGGTKRSVANVSDCKGKSSHPCKP
jgi:meiotically up-regulated gene 157 (Mug157) protein